MSGGRGTVSRFIVRVEKSSGGDKRQEKRLQKEKRKCLIPKTNTKHSRQQEFGSTYSNAFVLYMPHTTIPRGAAESNHVSRFPETSSCRGLPTFATCIIRLSPSESKRRWTPLWSQPPHDPSQERQDPHWSRKTRPPPYLYQHTSARKHTSNQGDRTCGRDDSEGRSRWQWCWITYTCYK